MNIGINDMSFYRISLSSLEEVQRSIINQKSISPDAKKRASDFVDQLQTGDINHDGTITKYEYDQFIESKGRSSKDKWLLELIDEKGEKLKAKPLTPSAMGPYLYEQIGVQGLTEDYQKKYDKVLESGLKIHLKDSDSSYGAMTKIDAAYKRLLAIEESKKTGIPIVVVFDSFNNPFDPHGNQIAKRDIEKTGLIPLSYDHKSLSEPEVVNEVIELKHKGINIQSLNWSVTQGKELTVTKLKEALEKDGIAEASDIKDDGSNLINYKSLIRDWLLNGKKKYFGLVSTMPGLEQLGLGTEYGHPESMMSFDRLAANSIDFVNAAGNFGPSTISIYSFVQGGTPVGALDSRGKIADYTSNTSLIKENAVVKGNIISIYEQGSGKVRQDYDGDGVYDEELPLVYDPNNKAMLPETVPTLEKLKLADKKVVNDFRARITELHKNESSYIDIDAFSQFFEDYVFKKEDLALIKKDLELIKQKNNHDIGSSKLFIEMIDDAQKQFSGDLVAITIYANLNQILVNPDNGKLQFINKSPIKGTSFAAPQVAVEKATVHSN